MSPAWTARCGDRVCRVSYAQISALIQSTPATHRQRLTDGTLIVGSWTFTRDGGV
jgi:hypothetical protein